MSFTRWYDKDENLKLVMQTIEGLDDATKLSIATDLIQMMMDKKFPHTDDVIDDLNADYLPIRRRWYDKFESLHSAVEMIKLVDVEDKQEVIKEILYSIFFFTECDNSKEK